jgi:hypothetical protein
VSFVVEYHAARVAAAHRSVILNAPFALWRSDCVELSDALAELRASRVVLSSPDWEETVACAELRLSRVLANSELRLWRKKIAVTAMRRPTPPATRVAVQFVRVRGCESGAVGRGGENVWVCIRSSCQVQEVLSLGSMTIGGFLRPLRTLRSRPGGWRGGNGRKVVQGT